MVLAISPSEGSVLGGQTIVILGENLRPGLTVMFGAVAAASQFITRHAVRALAPARTGPATVQVTTSVPTWKLCFSLCWSGFPRPGAGALQDLCPRTIHLPGGAGTRLWVRQAGQAAAQAPRWAGRSCSPGEGVRQGQRNSGTHARSLVWLNLYFRYAVFPNKSVRVKWWCL